MRRIIGYVPQMISADGTLSAYENLLVFAKLYDLPRGQIARRSAGVHGTIRIGGQAGPAVLGGHDPEAGNRPVDDPHAGSSSWTSRPWAWTPRPEGVWSHVEELRDRIGTTIILTTHQMEEADLLCDRIAIMHRGPRRAGDAGGAQGLDRRRRRHAGRRLHPLHGEHLESGGTYRDTRRTRRSASRLG